MNIPENSPLWNLTELQYNWDNCGGIAPSEQMFEFAQGIVDQLRYIFQDDEMPHARLTAKGGFQFEWINLRRPELELRIELSPDGEHFWKMKLEGREDAEGAATKVGRLVAVAGIFWCHLNE